MVAAVTLVILDPEENLDRLDQRETMEDLASAIPEEEDHRAREERKVVVDPAAPEETVVKREDQEKKDLRESQASQDLLVNLAGGGQEESLGVMEIPALRETPASLNVMS